MVIDLGKNKRAFRLRGRIRWKTFLVLLEKYKRARILGGETTISIVKKRTKVCLFIQEATEDSSDYYEISGVVFDCFVDLVEGTTPTKRIDDMVYLLGLLRKEAPPLQKFFKEELNVNPDEAKKRLSWDWNSEVWTPL